MPNSSVTQIAPSPAAQQAAHRLPLRAFWAILAGFLIVSSAGMLLGPTSGDVVAQEDDNAAAFWAQDRASRSPMPRQSSSLSRVTTIFGDFFSGGARMERELRQAVNRPAERAMASARERQAARQAQARSRERASGAAASHELVADGQFAPAAPEPRPTLREARAPAPRPSPQRGVCVRLCDGSHFPAPVGKLTDASCASVCPGAPTRAYLMRSDHVESAVSVRDGAPYAALPVALRYTQKADSTCSCGRGDLQDRILRDATLRRGDRVMTDQGFRLFRGGASPPFSPRDFNTIADARDLPNRERSLLSAMERAAGVRPAARRPGAQAALNPAIMQERQASAPGVLNDGPPRLIFGPTPMLGPQAATTSALQGRASTPASASN